MFVQEVKDHLIHKIIPFWEGLKDEEFGGYYGYKGFDLVTDKEAVKGCILNGVVKKASSYYGYGYNHYGYSYTDKQ